MTDSITIKKQIAEIQAQLDAKSKELGFVLKIEELAERRREIEREQEIAELELKRHLAGAVMNATDQRLDELNPSDQKPTPGTKPDPAAEKTTPKPDAAPSRDAQKLVANIAERLKRLTAGEDFDIQADQLINRVRQEGTPAVKALCAAVGVPYNSGAYRNSIKKKLQKR